MSLRHPYRLCKNIFIIGAGRYAWPDGAAYAGDWVNNHMHGRGCFTHKCGDRFEGRFEMDHFLNEDGHWIPVPAKYAFLPQA
jgi:hypothetical protein